MQVVRLTALGALLGGLALATTACSSGADFATPPPAATFQPPEYAWVQPVFPEIAGGRLADVAGDERGFVAVGSVIDARGVGVRGLVLVSRDGIDWRIADVPGLEQVDMLDVAVGPDGFVIVGERSPGPLLRFAALAVSTDGVAWETPALPDPDQLAYTFRIDWTDDRFVVIGTDLAGAGGAFELTSPDGRTWSSTSRPYQRRVVSTGAGWLGIGPMTTWTTLDGAPFEADGVPPDDRGRPADGAETTVTLPSGTLLVGSVMQPCGPLSSECGTESAAWWSADARSWAAVPRGEPGWPFRYPEVTMSDQGFAVAFEDGNASVSCDGWRWASLVPGGAPAPASSHASGIVAAAGRVVVVGETTLPDGTSLPWIATATTP
jgi:hypothetical protein